jgi:predicted aminopeptidase
MDALKLLRSCWLILLLMMTSACQLGYLSRSAWHHLRLMSSRMPVEKVLENPKTTPEEKRKLTLALEAREFSISQMNLKKSANYTTYIHVDQPYVTWVLSAAPKWKLEHHLWHYPIVGSMPYKGFPSEKEAKEEQFQLEKEDLDVFMRGVSAYSTLGWFSDSILSTMMRYQDHDLVNTILHENTHATLYIKNSADFNERMAVFVAAIGTQQFYEKKEGSDSATVKKIKIDNQDDQIFSRFIGPELEKLKVWYQQIGKEQHDEKARQLRLDEIRDLYLKKTAPQMKTQYIRPTEHLNNARLLYFKTYLQDLSAFEELWNLTRQDWKVFLSCLKTLENKKQPEVSLLELNAALRNSSQTCSTD